MAGRKRLPESLASSARTLSISSRNLRNMIQVSIGRRSRSPLRPLSLRMMSRQDLTIEASCWAVDCWTSFAWAFFGWPVFDCLFGATSCLGSATFRFGMVLGLIDVQERLQFVYRRSQIFGATEHLRNIGHTATVRDGRHFQNFGYGELRRAIVYILVDNIIQNFASLL